MTILFQALASQQDTNLYTSANSNQLNLSQMEMIGPSHANILFSTDQMKQPQGLAFVNSNSPQLSLSVSNALQNAQGTVQPEKGLSVGNYVQAGLSLMNQGNYVTGQSSVNPEHNILPNTFSNSNSQSQLFIQSENNDVKGNKVYTPKGSNKQAKSVPNILSKGSVPTANSTPSQTILLPSNMNGQYILVNSPAQPSQQLTAQPQFSVTQQDSQNQQLLVLPANIQQLVGTQSGSGSQISQNMSPSNQLKPLQQQPKLAPLRVRQKGKIQTNIAARTQSQATSGLSSAQSHNQYIKQTVGNQLQTGQQVQSTASNIQKNSTYQTYSQGKTGDVLKIVRPVAQSRGVTGKPGTGGASVAASSLGNTGISSSGTAHTAKLSHYSVPQNQLQSLQSMVTQQVNESLLQSAQIPGTSPGGQISSATSLSQSHVNSISTDQVNSMQGSAPQNVALQQLLRLSQAASQATNQSGEAHTQDAFASQQHLLLQGNAVHQNAGSIGVNIQANVTSSNSNVSSQNMNALTSGLSSHGILNVQGDGGITQQQLIQQLLSQQQQQSQQLQQLQQQRQQQSAELQQSEAVRASIIGQNVQNIIMRQNASKQSNMTQNRSSSPATKNTLQNNQPDTGNPMQLFIPKQLPTSQLLELQQKLLAGKIMQKMPAVQPKPVQSTTAVSIASTVSLPANSSVQTVTLKQVPLATSQQSGNQFVMPVVTQGMQFFLQTNSGSKQATTNSQSPQQIIVASGNNATQRINLPVIGASSANTLATNIIKQVHAQQQKSNLLQGVTIQNATTHNIIVKPLDAAGMKAGLSEQQKAIQTKKLQQLLLQLTPAQRNMLVKKQQQYMSKGLSIPLMKLIMEVKQAAGISKQVRPVCRLHFH